MSERAVVCVDDEAIILLSIQHALRAMLGTSFRVETALSAEAALKLLSELALDNVTVIAVISDWLMPGMRGDELLRRVGAVLPEACLLLLTGYADALAIKALEEDVTLTAVFQKPCEMSKIADAIRAHSCL